MIRKQTHRFARIRNIYDRDRCCHFFNVPMGDNQAGTIGDRRLNVIVAIDLRTVDADKQIPRLDIAGILTDFSNIQFGIQAPDNFFHFEYID